MNTHPATPDFWNQRLTCAAAGQGAPLGIRLEVVRPDNGRVECTLEDTYLPPATAEIISHLRTVAACSDPRPDRYRLRAIFYEEKGAPLCGLFDGTHFSATALLRWLGRHYDNLAQQAGGELERWQAKTNWETTRDFLYFLLGEPRPARQPPAPTAPRPATGNPYDLHGPPPYNGRPFPQDGRRGYAGYTGPTEERGQAA